MVDPEPTGFPSPWRTYRLALERTPPGSTHRLILQDDSEPCRDLPATVERAIAARPDRLLAFFHGGQPSDNAWRIRKALLNGQSWALLDQSRWIPAIALCWPVRLIAPALAWVEEQSYPPGFRADDEIIGRAMRELGESCLASVPSLVQHPDMVESLVGLRAKQGEDPARVAACFQGDRDPGSIDWALGPA